MGRTRYFHTKTMTPPVIMPANAPHLLLHFQNSAKSITGPKAAPNPAQAKETMVKTELLGSQASTTLTSAIAMTVPRATSMEAPSLILTWKKS